MGTRVHAFHERDVRQYVARATLAAAQRGLQMVTLGVVRRMPVVFFHAARSSAPRVLLAAGFHGDEVGGSWGLLDVLERSPQALFECCAVSMLPLVNPTGVIAGRRANEYGEDPNRGYVGGSPSREGALLLSRLPTLVDAATHGFVSLHEDSGKAGSFVYVYGNSPATEECAQGLLSATSPFFDTVRDGYLSGRGVTAAGGTVVAKYDGSFEDRMFRDGVPFSATTEIPGLAPFEVRTAAHRAIVEAFVEYTVASTQRRAS
jgi:predicted deacylase